VHLPFSSLALILSLLLPAAAAEEGNEPALALPAAYTSALAAARIPEAATAVVIVPLNGTGISVAVNDTTPMNPASTMKLVTTYAALHLLGPDFRWRTDALTAAPVTGRTLRGDLVLRGSGDPSLVVERFWLLVDRLRARGIDDIEGDLVLDRGAFARLEVDPSEFDGAPGRPYNVPPDALLVNFKAVAFTFMPDETAHTARILVTPRLAGMRVPASVPLQEGACGDWMGKLRSDFSAPLAPAFHGGYARACGERSWYRSVLEHPHYVEALFRGLWEGAGGRWHGHGRDGATPAGARVLASQESPPLALLIRDINKFSNNVMTRQLFLTLGARAGAAGSQADARAAIDEWLVQRGHDNAGLVVDNGAGLSRASRIRPAALAQLLADAWSDPRMPEFVASLPIAGVDGTTRRRTAAAGAAHIKTGLLRDVRALAGYVHAASGRRYVVVAIVNHANAAGAERAHDALLDWLHRDG
jgi:serine-type D-Ala-D-Ala carboxypeptidase/endopeptidase (penicillin-binding protein 4)